MRVLDVFSGTGSATQAFLDRGHEVLRVDNDQRFKDVPNTLIADVLSYDPITEFDMMWMSPPCQAFSLAATGTHMKAMGMCRVCGTLAVKEHERWVCDAGDEHNSIFKDSLTLEPKTEFGHVSVSLVERALELVQIVEPKFWWMENPNGGMIHFVPSSIPRVQVTYCQYGDSRQKLTNLWGDWPQTWTPRPRCANGAKCHEPASRGSKTGTQGISGAMARGMVPYELSQEICAAVESSLS